MADKGFLLVTMQPPPAFEEEFNAWYDTEHLPERLAVPGFETALRFVCLYGHPRYLAMYDLVRPEVLDSPEYLRVAFENSSPWTRRVLQRVRVYRASGRQIYPGSTVTGAASRVQLVRFRSRPVERGTRKSSRACGRISSHTVKRRRSACSRSKTEARPTISASSSSVRRVRARST